ncbi:MAG TPA: FlgD immunoglobulin-like domain containing protein, partial [Chitinophagaceae bacterium]|nr:FlgD immunoglobulin-like domain containing protein [Chitinophagaceae bacterium]
DMLRSMSTLPSFSDDEGEVILQNDLGRTVDDLRYDEKWHFALLDDKNGVSLERIHPNKATNDPKNWTSAASTSGFGTPTSKNSQFQNLSGGQSQVSLSSKMFSPDNDGIDDLCFINFQFNVSGYTANVSVFDINGKLVKKLVTNQTTSQNGNFRWDGMNDLGGKCSSGLYIILTEIFDLNGNRKKYKNAIALTRKF